MTVRRALRGGPDDGSIVLATTEVLDLDTMAFADGPEMLAERAEMRPLPSMRVARRWFAKGEGYLN